jgi:AcrR family transcriptional regulator
MVDRKSGNSEVKASKPRRKRRSTQEIVDRIVDAASTEFGENGYAQTTTAAIARRADVAEALIFNHFGNKANLFRKAVFKPLDDHFSNFVATHSHFDDTDRARESRAFVSDLVTFVRQRSGIFKSLVVNEAFASDEGSGALRGLQDYFDKMSAIEEARMVEPQKVPPRLISRLSFAAILGYILCEQWLIPDAMASDKEVHEAMCDFIMEGLSINPERHPRPARG